jgi:hypothetical protein
LEDKMGKCWVEEWDSLGEGGVVVCYAENVNNKYLTKKPCCFVGSEQALLRADVSANLRRRGLGQSGGNS